MIIMINSLINSEKRGGRRGEERGIYKFGLEIIVKRKLFKNDLIWL